MAGKILSAIQYDCGMVDDIHGELYCLSLKISLGWRFALKRRDIICDRSGGVADTSLDGRNGAAASYTCTSLADAITREGDG
jgi:hypothetical protein